MVKKLSFQGNYLNEERHCCLCPWLSMRLVEPCNAQPSLVWTAVGPPCGPVLTGCKSASRWAMSDTVRIWGCALGTGIRGRSHCLYHFLSDSSRYESSDCPKWLAVKAWCTQYLCEGLEIGALSNDRLASWTWSSSWWTVWKDMVLGTDFSFKLCTASYNTMLCSELLSRVAYVSIDCFPLWRMTFAIFSITLFGQLGQSIYSFSNGTRTIRMLWLYYCETSCKAVRCCSLPVLQGFFRV